MMIILWGFFCGYAYSAVLEIPESMYKGYTKVILGWKYNGESYRLLRALI